MFGRRKTNEVRSAEAAELQGRGAVLLDVREDDEWTAGHAPDARSGRAAKTLAAAGVDMHNVAGGMSAWASAGLPVVRDDGSPGRVS